MKRPASLAQRWSHRTTPCASPIPTAAAETIPAPETEEGETSTRDAVATSEGVDDCRPTEPMLLLTAADGDDPQDRHPTAGAVTMATPRLAPAPGVPPPVYYHAVRVGAQTFTVPDECLVATRRMQQPSEKWEELSHDEATGPVKKKSRKGHPLRQDEATGIVSTKVEPPHHALRLTHSHCCSRNHPRPRDGGR